MPSVGKRLQCEPSSTCSMNRSICATGKSFQHCHREQVVMRCTLGARGDGNSMLVLEWCHLKVGYRARGRRSIRGEGQVARGDSSFSERLDGAHTVLLASLESWMAHMQRDGVACRDMGNAERNMGGFSTRPWQVARGADSLSSDLVVGLYAASQLQPPI